MAIRVGRWDCPFCGHQGNLGPDKQCSACGKPRGADVKFYLPADAEVVTDDTQIAKAKEGPDWVCDYCKAGNAWAFQNCQACGNQRTLADTNLGTKVYGLNATPGGLQAASTTATAAMPRPVKKKRYPVLWAALAILMTLCFWPKTTTLSVMGHEWKRTIAIENYHQVKHEDWAVPLGGNLVGSYRAVHHYNKVLDHYETRTRTVRVRVGEERYISGRRDLGNGYFEDVYSTRPIYENREEEYEEAVYRNEPAYQTRYVYTIYEWVTDRTAAAQGRDKNPNWPQGAPRSDVWRDGDKTETYLLLLEDKRGNEYSIETEYDYWQRLEAGDQVKARKTLSSVKLIGDRD